MQVSLIYNKYKLCLEDIGGKDQQFKGPATYSIWRDKTEINPLALCVADSIQILAPQMISPSTTRSNSKV